MFDFAWSEMALIAVVALVVIGPKDLPRVLRTTGQWVRKARAIAREFQGNLEEMVREADLDDVKKHITEATRFNFEEELAKTVDPDGELQRSLGAPALNTPLIEPPKPGSETPAEALAAPEPTIHAPPSAPSAAPAEATTGDEPRPPSSG